MLLSTAMFLLNKDVLARTDIDYAEMLLMDFCRLYPEIYGNEQQTMNIHLLRHIPEFTCMYGPLFNTSCFGFESMNSYLKNMVHGTQHVNSQLSLAVGLSKALPRLVKTLDGTHSDWKVLVNHLSIRMIRYSDSIEDLDLVSLLGKKQLINITQEQRQAAQPVIPENAVAVKYFRLKKANEIYFCQENRRAKTRNLYTVLLEDGKFCFIIFFLLVNHVPMAMIEILDKEPCSFDMIINGVENDILNKYHHLPLNHNIKQVKSTKVTKLIPVEFIRKKVY